MITPARFSARIKNFSAGSWRRPLQARCVAAVLPWLLPIGMATPALAAPSPWMAASHLSVASLAPVSPAAQNEQEPSPQLGDQQGELEREQMWRPPTAEEWQKPCLIPWQRTWVDALAVMEETGRPILVCVNMDGEIASEHYAGIRYRQPEIAKIYEPYVTVIASVYRHTPRDWDEQGRRVPCPRFGQVTCGEHIAIETILYEQFFDGTRVAPRHIMVEEDGAETYDLFYANDTASVFQQVMNGILQREKKPDDKPRGDRSLLDRIASRDSHDRQMVERAYATGTVQLRSTLLKAAIQNGQAEQMGLLRLAVFDLDVELNKLARKALAKTDSNNAVSLIAEALRVPMDDDERSGLIAALARLGKSNTAAQTLAVVHTGLAADSSKIDSQAWAKAWVGAEYPAPEEWSQLKSSLDSKEAKTEAAPNDPMAQLELAEAALAFAVDPKTVKILAADPRNAARFTRLHFEDAHQAARLAESLGADGWRLDAVLCLTSFYLGDLKESAARAENAVALIPSGNPSWNSMAVLDLFASNKRKAISDAMAQKKAWPPEWLAELHAAHSILAEHPLGTADQAVAHYDFLTQLGAAGKATRALQGALKRFPDSYILHDRWRARVLHDRGLEKLEAVYDSMLSQDGAPRIYQWYSGLASIVAAESYRRAGQSKKALNAYDRAIAHYDRCLLAMPETQSTADHYVALAIAGRARLAYERGDWPMALSEVQASFKRGPLAAASLDGLNHSPVTTALLLRAKFEEQEDQASLATLQAALDELDPEMLIPPEFERNTPALKR